MYQELMLACMEGHFMQTFYTTNCMLMSDLKGLAQAKIIKKSVILFRVLNMTI